MSPPFQEVATDMTLPRELTERRELGRRLYQQVLQRDVPNYTSAFLCNAQLDQEFAELWTRTALSRKDRRWITLACLAGKGDTVYLRDHTYGALRSRDVTLREMLEAVHQVGIYAGFGCGAAFEATVWVVADELELAAPEVELYAPSEWESESERLAAGDAMWRAVMMPADSVPDPAPDLLSRQGMLGTVFAELWARGGLRRRERRVITLVAAALSGCDVAVDFHVKAALESGDLTSTEFDEFLLHFAFYAGWPRAQPVHRSFRLHAGSRE